jgi:hypothetical protein
MTASESATSLLLVHAPIAKLNKKINFALENVNLINCTLTIGAMVIKYSAFAASDIDLIQTTGSNLIGELLFGS